MTCFESIPDAVIIHKLLPYLDIKEVVNLSSISKLCRTVIGPELKKHISFSYKDGAVIFRRNCKMIVIKNCTKILISSKISNNVREFFLKFEYYRCIRNSGYDSYDSYDSYTNYNAYPFETKIKKYGINMEKAISYGKAIKVLSLELDKNHAFIRKSRWEVTFLVQEMPPYYVDEYDDYAEDYEEIYPTYEDYLIEQGEIDHRNIMRELVGELKGCIPIIL